MAGAQGPRVVVRFGDRVMDLAAAQDRRLLDLDLAPGTLAAPSLNELLARGKGLWNALRLQLQELLADPPALPAGVLMPLEAARLHLPVAVGDYVDGYGGIHHATNMGKILRPGGEPLARNWRHLPVAYHGRAGTVVASGHPVRRPVGQVVIEGVASVGPTAKLDVELEVGFVVGAGSELGRPIDISEAAEHIFGVVLVNDWSARDIQAFEYQPLGPFLGKSFATSISNWVVPLDALEPYMVPGLVADQKPPPAPYLATKGPWVPDLHLQVLLETECMWQSAQAPAVVSEVSLADAMYWSMAQQLAHATVNGASTRPGDLFASGTVSGPDASRQAGSFMELSWGGTRSVELPTGEKRTFLEDGDRVTLRGWCGGGDEGPRVDLGEVQGQVLPATGA